VSRPAGADWLPLADADPVPGDPYQVVRLSSSLRSVADGLKQQAETLRRLAGDQSWEGESGPKFRATATDTANRLAKVYPRYEAAANALLGYESELAAAQATSLRALQEAKSADQARAAHERRLDELDRADQGDSPEHEAVSARLDDAGTQLAAARRLLESAVHRRHEAARAAASHMSRVMDHDGLQDGFLDKAGDWVRRNADKIKGLADFCSKWATILGTVALLVSWVPVVGQALAAVLGTVALLLSAVALLCHVSLMAAGAKGASVADIVLDIIGLATFGVGRAAVAGVRAGAAAVRGGSRAAIATERVALAVQRRGGTLNEAARSALRVGDWRGAAAAARMRPSVVKGMVGDAYGRMPKEIGSASLRATRNAIAGAPVRLMPGGGAMVRAVSPVAIVRETVDAARVLRNGDSWIGAHVRTTWGIEDALTTLRSTDSPRQAVAAFTKWSGHPMGEEAAAAVWTAREALSKTPATILEGRPAQFMQATGEQRRLFWVMTGTAVTAGGGDLAGWFDRFKQ